MISSINNALPNNNVHQASPASQKAEPQAQSKPKSGALTQDQVTLKSAGNVNHGGENK